MADEPVFRPFDPDGQLRIYHRNLPHWRQPGATYFVTFRLDDSIPAAVLAEWLDIRRRWLQAHRVPAVSNGDDGTPSRGAARVGDPSYGEAYRRIPVGVRRAFEREQARMLHEELDRCHGSCVLRDGELRAIVADSLAHFHGTRIWLGDFVIMPNHIHLIVQPWDGWELEDVLGSIKKWTSRQIRQRQAVQSARQQAACVDDRRERLWQLESYDRIIRDRDELAIFRRYLAQNPNAAKLTADCYTYRPAPWLDDFAERPAFP